MNVLKQKKWPYDIYIQSCDKLEKQRNGVKLSQKDVDNLLEHMSANGFKPGTVNQYRQSLDKFLADLPEDKIVYADSIDIWRNSMLA